MIFRRRAGISYSINPSERSASIDTAEQLNAFNGWSTFPVDGNLHRCRHQPLEAFAHSIVGIVFATECRLRDDVADGLIDCIPGIFEELIVDPSVVQAQWSNLDQVNQFTRLDQAIGTWPSIEVAIGFSTMEPVLPLPYFCSATRVSDQVFGSGRTLRRISHPNCRVDAKLIRDRFAGA